MKPSLLTPLFVDFTYSSNTSSGTFRAGVSLALSLKAAGLHPICISSSCKASDYLASCFSLESLCVPLSSTVFMRYAQLFVLESLGLPPFNDRAATYIRVGTFFFGSFGCSISLVHDLYIRDIPSVYNYFRGLFYRIFVLSSIRRAPKRIVLSSVLASRLREHLSLDSVICSHIPLGFSLHAHARSSFHRTPYSILLVAAPTPNKCLPLALQLFAQLINIPGQGHWTLRLISCGKAESLLNECAIPSSKVTLYSSISDSQLHRIFHTSDYYLSISSHEGFGIGSREAVLSGCRSIFRDLPIHREASLGLGAYLSELSVIHLLRAINLLSLIEHEAIATQARCKIAAYASANSANLKQLFDYSS